MLAADDAQLVLVALLHLGDGAPAVLLYFGDAADLVALLRADFTDLLVELGGHSLYYLLSFVDDNLNLELYHSQ